MIISKSQGNDPIAYERGSAIKPAIVGKPAMNDDPNTQDERYAPGISAKPWMPTGAGEQLADYNRVRNVPGLSGKQTDERLAELGTSRADVLISARGRYYWVNGRKACPFETGPNNEIHPLTFERVRGLQ